MTALELLNALAVDLREIAKDEKFIAQYQESRPLNVYVQNVPTNEFQNDQYYPLLAVELINIEDDVEDSIASVLLTLGVYRGERSDKQDFLNLIEMVRQYLLTHLIVGKKFPLQFPIYMGVVEPTSENFDYANFFVQYRIPRPVRTYVKI